MSQRPETGADAVTPQMERFSFALSDKRRCNSDCRALAVPAPRSGEWVRYADVASLLKDRERLFEALIQKGRDYANEIQRTIAAEADRERLTRAECPHVLQGKGCACELGNRHDWFREFAEHKERLAKAERRAEALATAIREISDTLLTDHQNRVENGLDGLPEAEQELVAVARRLRALVREQD